MAIAVPRRENNSVREGIRMIPFSHASSTADTDAFRIWTVPAGRTFVITRVWYNNVTGLAQDASNYFTIKIADGTAGNVAASWSTLTGSNGTLTANTPVDFALSATEINRNIDGGEHVTLFLDETGAATLPAGYGIIEGFLA